MEGKQLDISKCFTDALEVYKVNVLMLLLSVLLFSGHISIYIAHTSRTSIWRLLPYDNECHAKRRQEDRT